MASAKATILITVAIDDALIKSAAAQNFFIDVIPFIKTENITSEKIIQQIKNVSAIKTTVVFTSSNAVNAVAEQLKNIQPAWQIFCIGNTTKLLTEKTFGKEKIIATADNATDLAYKISADKNNKKIYFFCGDKKRDELPALLHQNNIAVHEIEVYATTILQQTIKKTYDGIMFFSPSAVNGFFQSNKINEQTILFAIGTTTASEIKKFSTNKILISEKPGKKELLKLAIDYFS